LRILVDDIPRGLEPGCAEPLPKQRIADDERVELL
jgi:hypothetical protein